MVDRVARGEFHFRPGHRRGHLTEHRARGPGRKLPIYAREGVGHLWLVNPAAKTLEVYRLSDSNWTLLHTHVAEETVQAEPFGSASLKMSRWVLPEKSG